MLLSSKMSEHIHIKANMNEYQKQYAKLMRYRVLIIPDFY